MEQVNGPQWISWGLSEAWLSGKVLEELKVELGEALTVKDRVGGTRSLGCQRWTTPKAPRLLAWAGLGSAGQ